MREIHDPPVSHATAVRPPSTQRLLRSLVHQLYGARITLRPGVTVDHGSHLRRARRAERVATPRHRRTQGSAEYRETSTAARQIVHELDPALDSEAVSALPARLENATPQVEEDHVAAVVQRALDAAQTLWQQSIQ